MGCNVSKGGITGLSLHKQANSNGDPTSKPMKKDGEVVQVRKLSLPGDTPLQRRRLSVVQMDGAGVVDENTERGLIRMLEDKSTLDFCSTEEKKWSIATETDADLHRRASFGDKSINTRGSEFDGSKLGVGFACKKGLKPVSPNQDSFLLVQVAGGVGIYGVFDGHGRGGHDVSNFVKDMLPKLMMSHSGFHSEDLTETLIFAFHETQKLLEHQTRLGVFNASTSGTTGTVVVHRNDTLWVAHVGDSRAVLAVRDRESGRISAIDITLDHKPELPEEHERIISSGGAVIKPPMDFNHRVYVKGQKYPGLAMSRALGDLVGYKHAGISCTPDIACYQLHNTRSTVDKENLPYNDATAESLPLVSLLMSTAASVDAAGTNHQGHSQYSDSSSETSETSNEATKESDLFLLLCSDGVWEFVSSTEAVKIASKFPRGKAPLAAEELARVSWDRWMIEENGHVVDDITSLVVHL